MDAKITKKRLSRMLSYDWLKIIGLAAALIFVWVLVFTTSATRITPAQQFTAMNYTGNITWMGTNKFSALYNKAFNNGVFSYEVIETNINDLTTAREYVATLMDTRLATDEGDIMFVADTPDESSATTKDGKTVYSNTYLQAFLGRYRYSVYSLDPTSETSYFKKMESYLNRYYGKDGWKDSKKKLDAAKVEADFRLRVKGDKRFKTEKTRAQGVKDDIARIEKYRDALLQFYQYVEEGYITFTTTAYGEGENAFEGIYSINICPETLADGTPNEAVCDTMYEYVGYRETYKDEETGEEGAIFSAKNMNVAFFDLEGVEEGFQYESLLFVNYLLETCIEEGSAK